MGGLGPALRQSAFRGGSTHGPGGAEHRVGLSNPGGGSWRYQTFYPVEGKKAFFCSGKLSRAEGMFEERTEMNSIRG